MAVNLLHFSDTHLIDPPPDEPHIIADYPTKIYEDTHEAFTELINKARRLAMGGSRSAVIHTGDMFNIPGTGAGTLDESLQHVQEEIDRLQTESGKPIPFFVIKGNHDTKYGRDPISDVVDQTHARTLGVDPEIINDEVALYGVNESDTDDLVSGKFKNQFTQPPDDTAVILCLHTAIGSSAARCIRGAPVEVTRSEVVNGISFDIDAILCGHIHRRYHATEKKPYIFYSGTPALNQGNLREYGYIPSAGVHRIQVYPDFNRTQFDTTLYVPNSRPWINEKIRVPDSKTPNEVVEEVVSNWRSWARDPFEEIMKTYDANIRNPWKPHALPDPVIEIKLKFYNRTGKEAQSFEAAVRKALDEWGVPIHINITRD